MTPASKGITFTINADDRTAATFAQVLQGADKFGKNLEKGFGSTMKRAFAPTNLLSTLNLLKMAGSAVSGVFNSVAESVEEGARAQLAIKSFASVVSMSERHATGLARQLQEAAMNTMDLQGAMQMANRSMLAGLSFDQMKQITAFATRKSSTMGISTQSAVERIVMGLSRGSPQILDDFALLVDGIDQVKRGYNAIHGAKAFDSLGPAAQKSQIIEAAMKDMSVQMGRLGISGNESLVRFDGMRTAMADIVTDIKRAVATSPKLAGMAKSLTDQFVQARTFISDNFEGIAGIIDRSLGGTAQAMKTLFGTGPMASMLRSFDFGRLMPSLTAFVAKVPLLLSNMALRVQRKFLEIGAAVVDMFASMVDGLAGPLGKIFDKVDSLTGKGGGLMGLAKTALGFTQLGLLNKLLSSSNKEATSFEASMGGAGGQLRAVADGFRASIEGINANLGDLAASMKDIDKLAGQLGKGGGMAALAQQAAAGLLNVRAAFAGVAASAREAFDPIGKRLGEIKAKSDEAAKGIGDRLKKAMEEFGNKAKEAGDKVKQAHDRLLELQRAEFDQDTDEAKQRFDILMARTRDPRAQNRGKFEFANWLGHRAGLVGGEQARGLLQEKQRLLGDLLKDPRIMRDRRADRMVWNEWNAVGMGLAGGRRMDVMGGIGDVARAQNDQRAALAEQARLGHQLNAQAFNDGALKPLKASFDGLKRTVQELGGAIKVVVRNAGAVGAAANPGGGALGRFFAGVREVAIAGQVGG